MCGIAGCIVAPGTQPDQEALRRMAAALAHRGPDEQRIAVDGNVGFANARLEIVAPGAPGRQPMEDRSGQWLITYNGEIFNHVELHEQLPDPDWRGSDTQTLLDVLAAWGDSGIERCNGLFAFAALDRARRRVLLVRDRFGKKPLYIARTGGAVWFASEIDTLFAGGVPRRARPEVLHEALRSGFVDGRDTPVQDVERVPPGSLVEVDLDTLAVSERRWFEPGMLVDPAYASELGGMSRADLARELERALRVAVRRRLMADAKVGTMCSGGIDSGLITAYAADDQPDLPAFHASVGGGPKTGEQRWAEEVTRALGLELEVAQVSTPAWRAGLVDAVRHYGYPLPNSTCVGIAIMSQLAQRAGVRVLLVGEAADELFGGYLRRHRREYDAFLPAKHRVWRKADEVRGVGTWRYMRRRLRSTRKRTGQKQPSTPFWTDGPALQAAREREARERATAFYGHHPGARGHLEGALLADLEYGPLPQLLNRMDKNTMQHSIETRVPFLDPDLAKLAVNLPLEARTGPQAKGLLRDLAATRLPRAVARRPKQAGPVVSFAESLDTATQRRFLEEGLLREVLEVPTAAWQSGVAIASGNRKLSFWSAEIWCRLFLAGRPADQIEDELWRAPVRAGG
jgi:asparagine synthase (glutamine-hydrolysing)